MSTRAQKILGEAKINNIPKNEAKEDRKIGNIIDQIEALDEEGVDPKIASEFREFYMDRVVIVDLTDIQEAVQMLLELSPRSSYQIVDVEVYVVEDMPSFINDVKKLAKLHDVKIKV